MGTAEELKVEDARRMREMLDESFESLLMYLVMGLVAVVLRITKAGPETQGRNRIRSRFDRSWFQIDLRLKEMTLLFDVGE